MKTRNTVLLAALLIGLSGCGRPEGGRSRAVLENKGSDTLVNVAQAWAEAYQTVNPNLAIAVTGGGSGTGIAALINGTVDLANTSREIKDSEMEQARAAGRDPRSHTVGFDALAVFLHPSNPLSEMSILQLAGIYGETGTTTKWTELGVTVPGCRDQEIVRVSRQNNSGTYEYFREAILGRGDFKLGSRDMHGSTDVVDLVKNTACAIGYSGLAYASPQIKMPCVTTGPDAPCVTPSEQTALDGSYPIARPLFMYTDGEPTGSVKEYLDWILSDAGQCIIMKMGYAPVKPVTCPASTVVE